MKPELEDKLISMLEDEVGALSSQERSRLQYVGGMSDRFIGNFGRYDEDLDGSHFYKPAKATYSTYGSLDMASRHNKLRKASEGLNPVVSGISKAIPDLIGNIVDSELGQRALKKALGGQAKHFEKGSLAREVLGGLASLGSPIIGGALKSGAIRVASRSPWLTEKISWLSGEDERQEQKRKIKKRASKGYRRY